MFYWKLKIIYKKYLFDGKNLIDCLVFQFVNYLKIRLGFCEMTTFSRIVFLIHLFELRRALEHELCNIQCSQCLNDLLIDLLIFLLLDWSFCWLIGMFSGFVSGWFINRSGYLSYWLIRWLNDWCIFPYAYFMSLRF